MIHTRSVRAGNSSLPLGQGQPPNNVPPLIPPQIPTQLPPQLPPQFGVFQLVLAQLLARNNPGDPLINLLHPAQQPPAPQPNPQPVHHAPAISESQGQSHIAPAPQPIPDDVTRRLDSLEKLVAEHRGAPPPHHAADSIPHPLNTNITLEPYPAGFKIPQLETYDGTKDPDDHLHAFYSCMQAQNASDALMCKIFPSTLQGNARTWYYSLPPRSTSSYTEMEFAFATKFSSRRLIRKTTSELMRVKQRDGESLKNYMSRFNDAVLEVNSFDQAVGIAAVISGLKHDRFRDSLIKHAATTFSERAEQPRFVREQRPQPQGVRNPPNRQGVGYQQALPLLPPPARIIHMITGGLEAGGLSSKQRKLYVREVKHQNRAQKRKINDAEWKNQLITFTSADLDTVVTPHNDPLVTSVMINNCEVQRVLVDTGSASDIMYFHCFESLGLDPALLQKYDGPIYGFNNQPVPVEGVLTLYVAFGSGRTYVALQSGFSSSRWPLLLIFNTVRKSGGGKTLLYHLEIVDNRPEDETRAAPVEDVEEVLVDDRDPSRKTQIGTRLNPEERAELIAFLRANNDLKSYLSSPPLLTKAVDGEILYLYLGISDEAISSVLVREEAKQQKPIYYISSVLHGAELRYPIAEKAALAVVTSARKLRPYFQSHPIIVLTDQPLQQILQKPECSGRLIKWAVELGEFEITFQQRSQLNEWTLYVDGASSSKGSGAGALLIGPDGYRSEHALKFNFDSTNNMAEYKALLLGLQLALELKISAIQVYSDSQLVVNQINSICEVVDPMMVKYAALVAELKCKFQKFCLSKIPRAENKQADSLSKFASDSSLSSRSVFVEVLDQPSFTKPRVMEISTNPDALSWIDSIVSFLRDGIVPEDGQEALKLRKKASRYTLVDGVQYKRSFSLPLLRCLNPYEAEYALREVHEGVCGSHVGARTLAHKVLRQGYYWPNMYKDATYFVQKCPKCQFFAHLTHQPAEELTNMVAPWPFAQWGLDLLGPFVKGVGGVTHLVVSVDYFTKWVEARPLSSLTSKKVEDFVFSSIICRYGIPNQIVADNGTQFNCSSFRDFCSSYEIKLQFTSVYHPESNGMVESVNKCILEGIRPRLEQHKAKWADKLNNVLWAYRTMSRTATGETPYHLAFGTEAVIPVEIGVSSFWVTHFDEERNGQLLRENLDLLAEVREEARLRTLVYKQKLANFYNKRVRPRTFKVGDLVLRKAGLTGFETRFGKLAPNWEGLYAVAEVPHPGAYILQDAEGKRVPRVWNVNNLKKFYP
ncbi:hypothetical protein SLEP1_g51893 [Rubroshorea leprosula]|uniref:Uncharacterized protein n=1 Tax=Rubroshorea leprosula TaxID=152421 RepID=A0AAV5M4M2_9ROSI|nr:hypothetical protein SLEP1_g51893 [Rubroshorea leprosula]